jgi:peroxin-3
MTSAPSSSTSTSPSLRHLINETSDLIDSPSFTHVLTLLLDAAFSHLIDTKISALSYKIPPVSDNTARIQEIVGNDAGTKAKVANSLAVFCRQAGIIGTGVENEYLERIEGVRELEAFAAVVYSSHFLEERLDGKREEVGTGAKESGEAKEKVAGFESAWDKALAKEEEKAV